MRLIRTLRKNLATVIAALVVAAALIASFVAYNPWRAAGAIDLTVVIHDGEGHERRLPLSVDDEVLVTTELGSNTVTIQNGAVRITAADCPHGDCIRQAAISFPGKQLICLPHKLWVEVVANGEAGSNLNIDAVSQEDTSDVDLVAR